MGERWYVIRLATDTEPETVDSPMLGSLAEAHDWIGANVPPCELGLYEIRRTGDHEVKP